MIHDIDAPTELVLALQIREGESLSTHAMLMLWLMGQPKFRKTGLRPAVCRALGVGGNDTFARHLSGQTKSAPDWQARIAIADREGDGAGRVALAFWQKLHEKRLGMEPVKALYLRGLLRFASLDDEIAALSDPDRRRLAKQAEERARRDKRRRLSIETKIEQVDEIGDALLKKLSAALKDGTINPRSADFKMVMDTWSKLNETLRKEQADLEAPQAVHVDPLAASVRVSRAVQSGDRRTILEAIGEDIREIGLAISVLGDHEADSNIRPSERFAG